MYRKYYNFVILCVVVAGCGSVETFTIQGQITSAQSGSYQIQVNHQVKEISADQEFSFQLAAHTAYEINIQSNEMNELCLGQPMQGVLTNDVQINIQCLIIPEKYADTFSSLFIAGPDSPFRDLIAHSREIATSIEASGPAIENAILQAGRNPTSKVIGQLQVLSYYARNVLPVAPLFTFSFGVSIQNAYLLHFLRLLLNVLLVVRTFAVAAIAAVVEFIALLALVIVIVYSLVELGEAAYVALEKVVVEQMLPVIEVTLITVLVRVFERLRINIDFMINACIYNALGGPQAGGRKQFEQNAENLMQEYKPLGTTGNEQQMRELARSVGDEVVRQAGDRIVDYAVEESAYGREYDLAWYIDVLTGLGDLPSAMREEVVEKHGELLTAHELATSQDADFEAFNQEAIAFQEELEGGLSTPD